MKKVGYLVVLFACFLIVTPALAGIPADVNSDDKLTKDELADAILAYMLGGGDLSLEDLRDAAYVYVYWNGEPKTIVDSDGKEVEIYRPIKRIVVLGTTHAEVLRSLGAEDKIVGISTYITKKPDFFPKLKELPTVGSGYRPDYEAIINLKPDIVLQYSGWTPEMDEKLEPFGIKVIRLGFKLMNYTREVASLGDILDKKNRS